MSRIGQAFKGKKAFIPFITVGDPDIETTMKCVDKMIENGADLIELGIPFSDPTAEGPVIMAADQRALKSGTSTDDVFEFTRELRKKSDIPVCYMTYANVVFSYGSDKFFKNAAEAGCDGLILPDVPYEEREDFLPFARKYGIDLISMIAPTSLSRIRKIASEAEGFIYVVSSLGVTGVRKTISTDIGSIVGAIRENTSVPCAVGFGISDEKTAGNMSELSDGAIVGSAIMRIIEKEGKASAEKVGEFVGRLSGAVHK